MSLFKIILYIVLAYMVLRFVRRLLTPSRANASRTSRRQGRSRQNIISSRTVRCENCGMFITEKSALMVGDTEFCSKKCAEARVHKR
jgi:hypothetical protein